MMYLRDFAWSFVVLFGGFFDVLAASIIVAGMMLVLAWSTIPHIAKRV